MSLLNLMRKKCHKTFFTTPSHGQRFFICSKFRQFYKCDISETDAHDPQTAFLTAQKAAAKIYKTKSTHFLTNGSTSGIIAAVLACAKKGDKVLIWDKAHRAHLNAAKLSGAEPVFYEVEKNEQWGIPKSVCPEIIEKELKKGGVVAVVVTSPSYEGVVSDIRKIKEVCKKYGAYLIVDEAHGALYPFCDELPTSAIYQGADFVIQSLHKTAGGLNPTALLHSNTDSADIESSLDLITTTSPSYPLLMTIEKNINFLNSKRGRKTISDLVDGIQEMKKNLLNCEFYHGDETKILFKVEGMSGYELSKVLFEKYNIEDETANEKSVMLLTGVGTDFKKLKKLENALKKIKNI